MLRLSCFLKTSPSPPSAFSLLEYIFTPFPVVLFIRDSRLFLWTLVRQKVASSLRRFHVFLLHFFISPFAQPFPPDPGDGPATAPPPFFPTPSPGDGNGTMLFPTVTSHLHLAVCQFGKSFLHPTTLEGRLLGRFVPFPISAFSLRSPLGITSAAMFPPSLADFSQEVFLLWLFPLS